jgi:hypothetical protein
MKLLIMQCSPVMCSAHKYTPQHSVVRTLNPHPALLCSLDIQHLFLLVPCVLGSVLYFMS